VLRGMAGHDVLHFDAHGRYDAAFPELATLSLADRPLTLEDMAAVPAPSRLVNVSGCQTGAWPLTADSGHYGVGGYWVRLGTPWAIAARTVLADELAFALNETFYAELSRSGSVAAAYGRAHAEVRARYPVRQWAGFLLLHSGRALSGPPRDEKGGVDGQMRTVDTPPPLGSPAAAVSTDP
ncbi:MAG: CHAT domain-containing protein, partial [Acidobacteriota bacterium]